MRVENGTTSLNVAEQAKQAPTTNKDKVHVSQAENPTPYTGEGQIHKIGKLDPQIACEPADLIYWVQSTKISLTAAL